MPIKEEEFQKMVFFIKNKCGIDLSKKKVLIEGRLSSWLRVREISDYTHYLDILVRDESGFELNELLNRVTTNLTYFMRESTHFEYLQKVILPQLESEISNRDLRIWCAGCATGEEAYTIAMLLADYFETKKSTWNKQILATDISEKALKVAQKGLYSAEAVEKLPVAWRNKYFREHGDGVFEISEAIRKEVAFAPFNLMETTLPFREKFHVIFCRNVMIYFDTETKQKLVQRFCDATVTGGYLFVGHSESVSKEVKEYKYLLPAAYRKVTR